MRNPSKVAIVIAIVFLLAWVSDSEPLLAGSDSPTVRIGVLANRGSDRCLSQWAPTAQYLSEKVPDRSFQIIPVDFEQIFSVVKNSEVEFILANPSFYVELEHGFRVNRIATLRTRHTSGAYTRFAGVIFTRADRTDLHTLKELKGKQFMAVDESSMGGWHMAWRELLQNDIDPYHDFASLTFAGYHDAVVLAVLEKRVDAGTVRSDILERMAAQGLIRLDQIHVFPPPPEEAEGLPFLHSTRTDDKALLGQPWTRFLEEAQVGTKPVQRGADGEDGQLKTVQGKTLSIRLSKATACIREQNYTIHGFLDISDMRQLFEQQAVNIELTKGLLALVNPVLPRYCAIGDRTGLHIEAISLPCRAAGGDHFFFRHLPGNNNGAGPATFLSIKDQSGHEVNCILRSIFTDLTHNAALQNDSVSDFERTIQQLNNKLMRGGMFAEDDFLTAILAHIDHATLNMQFASCGHPPFLLIRKGHIASLPHTSGVGQNLPLGAIREIPFSAGRVRLQHGDKLLFYTDGLTEMPLEKHGWKISRQQMESLVAYLIRKKPACRVGDLMVDLMAAVAALSNQQVYPPDVNSSADDVTLIGLEMEDIDFGQTKTLQPLTTEALCADIRELGNIISGPWQAAGLVNAGQRVHIVLEEALLNAWKNWKAYNCPVARGQRLSVGNN